MNLLYNTQEEIATNFVSLFKKIFPNIRKTVLNILPYILIGMILAESSVASDIAKKLKGHFSSIQFNSVVKRINRFFSNKLFDPYNFYNVIITFVISHYKKKHNDNRVHIIFDHEYSKENYVVFMLTMRIGKQSIPLWFRCFSSENKSDAFVEDTIKEGISYVSKLFGDGYKLIFLADRWFNSVSLLKYIDSLAHTFVIRIKRNVKLLIFDKKEGHYIWKWFDDLFAYKYHASYYNDIPITDEKYNVNIAVSKSKDTDDPWLIITNGDPKRAIKDYGYRFGGIEPGFKNQKSNGFYIESTCNASLKHFTTMYTCVCTCILFLTILGTEFSKNSKCYKDVKIATHTKIKGKKVRIMSLFNTGLTLFNIAYDSSVYIRLPFRLILYDI